MSFNKEALIRYRTIDTCLRKRSKKSYTLLELQEAIEDAIGKTISISMLQKDINAMRYDEALGYNAPIEYDYTARGYGYSNPDYSISKLPLNQNELESLHIAAQTLKQYSERGIFKHFDDAIDKIKQAVNMSGFVDNESTLIQFEQTEVARGVDWIQTLYRAISDRYVVEITYKKVLSDIETTYKVEPYLLKEYRQRWYVIGRETDKKRIQTFGLDRVINIIVTRKHFMPDDAFKPDAYFKYSMGISTFTQSTPINVELRFGAAEAHFVLSKPLHPTQQILKQTSKFLDIEITVYDSYELISAILGYGQYVEVLKPIKLRTTLKNVIEGMAQKYR